MRILLLGNYSGHRDEASNQAREYSITSVDIDNFDQTLAKIKPGLRLTLDETLPEIEIEFEDLDDFHPDNLFAKIPLFERFSGFRRKLLNSTTVREGADELRALLNVSRREGDVTQPPAATDSENDSQALERLLGDAPVLAGKASLGKGERIATDYIRRVVSEHIVEDLSQVQSVYIEAVDDAIGALMRQVLHQPEFQALEAAWRSLHVLITSVEIDEMLSLQILDIDKEQLRRELSPADGDIAATALCRQLAAQTDDGYGGEPWSLLVGNYSFDDREEDMTLLAAMGVIASHAGCPFIAAAEPALLGCRAWPEQTDHREWAPLSGQWQAVRQSAMAPWLGLIFPRILLRLPYGAESDPIDAFNFEEMAADSGHESFLWGNGAFWVALLIAQTFSEQGWDMQLGDYLEIADLPAYLDRRNGGEELKPCAEACITDSTMETILDAGIMPLLSHRRMNRVRLAGFRSIADPPEALRAAWNRG